MKPLELAFVGVAALALALAIVFTVWSSRDAKRGIDVYAKLANPAGSGSSADAKTKTRTPERGERRPHRPGPPQTGPRQPTPPRQMKPAPAESPFGAAAASGYGTGALPGNAKATVSEIPGHGAVVNLGDIQAIDISEFHVVGGEGGPRRITTIGPDGKLIETTILMAPIDGSQLESSSINTGDGKSGAAIRVGVKKK